MEPPVETRRQPTKRLPRGLGLSDTGWVNRLAALAALALSVSPSGDAARVPERAVTALPQVAKPAPLGFVTAMDQDCSHGGLLHNGMVQFVAGCAGVAPSPDGRLAIRQKAGEHGEVALVDGKGMLQDDISALRDDMPYVVSWSPNGRWLFANHYLGSIQDRLRLFEVVNRTVVERSDIYAEAIRTMVDRYPCLGRKAMVVASAWRWSRDGRYVLLVAYSRGDACRLEHGPQLPHGGWEPLWMIGDTQTGRVDLGSVRVRRNAEAPPPKDGPYARF